MDNTADVGPHRAQLAHPGMPPVLDRQERGGRIRSDEDQTLVLIRLKRVTKPVDLSEGSRLAKAYLALAPSTVDTASKEDDSLSFAAKNILVRYMHNLPGPAPEAPAVMSLSRKQQANKPAKPDMEHFPPSHYQEDLMLKFNNKLQGFPERQLPQGAKGYAPKQFALDAKEASQMHAMEDSDIFFVNAAQPSSTREAETVQREKRLYGTTDEWPFSISGTDG